jgi:hypothetical protein
MDLNGCLQRKRPRPIGHEACHGEEDAAVVPTNLERKNTAEAAEIGGRTKTEKRNHETTRLKARGQSRAGTLSRRQTGSNRSHSECSSGICRKGIRIKSPSSIVVSWT